MDSLVQQNLEFIRVAFDFANGIIVMLGIRCGFKVLGASIRMR